MNSGWYIVQNKRNDMGFDQINILLGPFRSQSDASAEGPAFEAKFKAKYPGERIPLMLMQIGGWCAMPEGKFNHESDYVFGRPYDIGFQKS